MNPDLMSSHTWKTYIYMQGRAFAVVRKLVLTGKLSDLKRTEKLCKNCSVKRATMYHHKDYSKPSDVIPVCHSCNTKLGREKVYIYIKSIYDLQ